MSEPLMEELQAAGVTLPVGYCLKCHKEVMVHGRLGSGRRENQLVWHCLFCDDEILQEAEGLREHTMASLKELGYQIVEPEALESSGGGCGSGGGGCGSGGGGCHS